jgi:hypothetical protein
MVDLSIVMLVYQRVIRWGIWRDIMGIIHNHIGSQSLEGLIQNWRDNSPIIWGKMIGDS